MREKKHHPCGRNAEGGERVQEHNPAELKPFAMSIVYLAEVCLLQASGSHVIVRSTEHAKLAELPCSASNALVWVHYGLKSDVTRIHAVNAPSYPAKEAHPW
jgi:hypothetical protein